MTSSFVPPRRFLALGVIVAFSPAWAIFVAYLYELGYASSFNIDSSFIEMSVGSVAGVGLHALRLVVLLAVILQTVSFGLAHVEFRNRDTMYLFALGEALFVGALATGRPGLSRGQAVASRC